MKLSTNFLKDYIDIDVDVKQLAEDMTRVGNEYDSASNLINATKLVIGQITECEPHPDSDHLHLCKVNIGTEVLDIVCGAPNARTGLKVIVALDGAVLPEKTIKKGMIRGQESNGMLCSIAELGLEHKFLKPEDSEGIAELGEDAEIGGDPIKYLQMDDGVIDFELTANRGDLLSILGMAYEVGAIYDKKVKEVDLKHKESGEDINKTFKTEVKTENCSKLLVKKVENVKIEESPIFIKNRLIASGIRPINNVVDISNYVMLELGQPLHFYDADKLGNKLVVRMAEDGEKLTTLDNVERTLTSEDIVIADATHGVGLAGVMGGLETEVEPDTKNIIIESAIFDSVKVRKTSKKIVRSEASNRFEKGLDPERTTMAIERACKLLEEYAGGTVVTGTVEYASRIAGDNNKISTRFTELAQVVGEAGTWAKLAKAKVVTSDFVKKALEERVERIKKYDEKYLEMIKENTLLINTTGSLVGEINGLTVMTIGDYTFGKPAKITVNTYTGKQGVVNIEREVDLSGSTHSKGVYILSGYLGELFAQDIPLCLTASICFEQLYNGVDGDSASSTELYGLLSSLSEIPIKQSIAVTGSVNQKGQIQPIGGVNEKIEGYFQICKMRGLDGSHGVMIPVQNVENLQLNDDVVEAVKNNLFHIYAVSTIDEGIEVLTGVPAGKKDKDGKFPAGTVNYLAYEKLKKYAKICEK